MRTYTTKDLTISNAGLRAQTADTGGKRMQRDHPKILQHVRTSELITEEVTDTCAVLTAETVALISILFLKQLPSNKQSVKSLQRRSEHY